MTRWDGGWDGARSDGLPGWMGGWGGMGWTIGGSNAVFFCVKRKNSNFVVGNIYKISNIQYV